MPERKRSGIALSGEFSEHERKQTIVNPVEMSRPRGWGVRMGGHEGKLARMLGERTRTGMGRDLGAQSAPRGYGTSA